MSAIRRDWSVRRATARDLDSVLAIERAWPALTQWSRKLFEDELGSERSRFIVAEREGNILGYACLRIVAPEAELLDIAVSPEAARSGIGRDLLGRLHDEARAADCGKIFLEVRESNAPARALYGAFGYRIVGRRPKYYNGEDALLMETSL